MVNDPNILTNKGSEPEPLDKDVQKPRLASAYVVFPSSYTYMACIIGTDEILITITDNCS